MTRAITPSLPDQLLDRRLQEDRDHWLASFADGVAEVPSLWGLGGSETSALRAEVAAEAAFDGELFERMEELAKGSDFLLYAELVTALGVFLHGVVGVSGPAAVVVGSPSYLGDDDGTERETPGGAVPIRVVVDPARGFRHHLVEVRRRLLDGYAHQVYPADRLRRDLRGAVGGGGDPERPAPLFELAASYSGLHGELAAVGQRAVLQWRRRDGELLVKVIVAPELVSEGPWQCFFEGLRGVLADGLAEPDRPLSELAQAESPWPDSAVLQLGVPVEKAMPPSRAPMVAPRTADEERVAALWSEVLGDRPFGVHDNFFAVGGHSLLALQVLSRLRARHGVRLSVQELFDQPTVAELAALFDDQPARELPAIEPVPRDRPIPLSHSQERLWFLQRLEPERTSYNVPIALRLRGELWLAALEAAFRGLLVRHEILRTTFPERDGRPVQEIGAAPERPFTRVDLDALPEPLRWRELRRLARREASRPFDLTRQPPLRLTFLCLGDGDAAVLATLHHVASDGWSQAVLVGDLLALYRGALRSEPSGLPRLPIQYADYAAWQRRNQGQEVLAEELDYWRRQLAGLEVLELSHDRPRSSGPAAAGRLASRFPTELRRGLEELSRSFDTTVFMTLLATFQAVLHRLTGQHDVAVGTAVANRERPELEGLIGFFVNMLVLRGDCAGDPTVGEHLRHTRETTVGAFAHQTLPFERLVEELQPERHLSRAPLFQVVFTAQNVPQERVGVPGLEVEPLAHQRPIAKYDLIFGFEESAEELVFALEYDASIFDRTTELRFLRHFRRAAAAMVEDPRRRLSELAILTSAERHQLVVEWQGVPRVVDAPTPEWLPAVFAARVAERPGAIALRYGDRDLTYGELASAAHRLARRLRQAGVSAEAPVAVCLERSAELVVALLAVLEAGGCYLPLDPEYPSERLAFMLGDSGARVVVSRSGPSSSLPSFDEKVRVLLLDPEESREGLGVDREPASVPALVPAGAGDRLAYIVYTSGSTGRPKGVAVTHRAVLRLVTGTDYLQLGPEDRVGQAATVSFDAATFELWGALVNGARVVEVRREELLSSEQLAAAVRRERLTALFLTTAIFLRVARERPGAFASLANLLVGGEAMDPGAMARMLADEPPARLLHVYGPTENTTFSSWQRVYDVPAGSTTVPIGRPIADDRWHVVDRHFSPVPIMVSGELCLGGEGLARGYSQRPAATAESFVPDSFGGSGGRLYRTGDRVRRRSDGTVEFLGRFDQQVKIRGFRIEPGEVESVLVGDPRVADAVVGVRGDGTAAGERRLVAYAVPAAGATLDAASLRERCRAKLPAFMVPADFAVLDALPLGPTGKVDRVALERLVLNEEETEGGYVAPRNPVEAKLAELWGEVLGRSTVGAEDDFFDLGGHSLQLTQLASRVRESFGREIPLTDFFIHGTVAEMALLIVAGEAGSPAEAPIPRVPREGELLLSPAQERLWFLDQLHPGDVLYNVPAAQRLRGSLQHLALARAVAEVVDRHEALRTTFPAAAGRPRQEVVPVALTAAARLPLVDLGALPAPLREAEARRQAWREAACPFDLTHGPLARFRLLRLADDDHVLLLTLHHVIADGWSMGILLRELAAWYGALTAPEGGEASRVPKLPELPIQYADFAAWQRRQLDGGILAPQLDYWRHRLEELPELELPVDGRPRGEVSARGGRHVFPLSEELSSAVSDLHHRRGYTPFMTLLAAFAAILAVPAGVREVPVGTVIANRNRREVEGLIGFFVNSLVLRVDVGGEDPAGPTFELLLERVRETALGAYDHQDFPFEKLVEELQPERRFGRNPLFQVVFSLQNAPRPAPPLADVQLEPLLGERENSKFDLQLDVWEHPGRLVAAFHYRAELFRPTTVARLAGRLVNLLEAALARPDTPVAELPLLAAAERHQLLREWNDAPADPAPADLDLASLFASQVASLPDGPALTFDARQDGAGHLEWSYAELYAKAKTVAEALRRRGVGPGRRVALFFEPEPALIAALLGVLEAGAAYVPLDTESPPERLALILDDTYPSVVLTSEGAEDRLPEAWQSDPRRLTVGAGGEVAEDCTEVPGTLSHSRRPSPEAVAYVIYTSGSTGKPKGVEVTHGNVLRLLRATEPEVGFGADDVWTLFHSAAFDFSVWEIWGVFAHGGRLVIVPHWTRRSPTELWRLLHHEKVTVLNQTPSAFRQLLQVAEEPAPPALRCVIFGGEALDLATLAPWYRRFGDGVRLVNMYGITETTVHVTWRPLLGQEAVPGPSAIGRPLRHLQVHLLDRRLSPVPIGVPGELYVGGGGVSRGYLGRPSLTAERFVPDLFGEEVGSRLYRSGDLARRLADGELEYLGRGDLQIKLRGFRIEPGEIEAALRDHSEVEDAVVILRKDGAGDRRLVAYLVPAAIEAEQAGGVMPDASVDTETMILSAAGQSAAGQSVAGLRSAIIEVVRRFSNGGRLEVLGLRSQTLAEAERVSSALAAAPADQPAGELRAWLEETLGDEAEEGRGLPLDPTFFAELVEEIRELGWYGVRPDSDGGYTVVLGAGPPPSPVAEPPWLDWAEVEFPEALRTRLEEEEPEVLGVVGVPSLRQSMAVAAQKRLGSCPADLSVGALREELAATNTLGVEPPELCRLAAEAGYLAEASWAWQSSPEEAACYDVALVRQGAAVSAVELPAESAARLAWVLPRDAATGASGTVPVPEIEGLVPRLRGFLRERLPEPMVPAAFAVLPELPLTENGKLDRSTLPAPEVERADLGTSFVAPRDEAERQLAEIWRELLDCAEVGVHDNFFDLGGHSLLATQVVSRVGEAFGVELPLRVVFEAPTIAALAERLHTAGADPAIAAASAPPLVPSPRDDELPPLSFAQERLWFLHRLRPSNPDYNELLRFPLGHAVDVAALRGALAGVVARHEILRTAFPEEEGRPVQRILTTLEVSLPVVDISGLREGERGGQLRRLASSFARRPFDLARVPLLRSLLVRLAPERHHFLLLLHHILVDGWSLGILRREMTGLYEGLRQGVPLQLPPLPVQYADYASWQRRWLSGPVLEEQLAAAQRRLAGVCPLELPVDHLRTARPTVRGASLPWSLPPELSTALSELAQGRGATLFMAYLAAFAVHLARLAGQNDLTVGAPVANRDRRELEGMVGFFVNMLVLRIGIDPERSFLDQLDLVRKESLAALDQRELPFARLVEALQPERDPTRNPLFQVCFQLYHLEAGTAAGGSGVSVDDAGRPAGVETVHASAKFDLYLGMVVHDRGVSGFFEYNADLLDETTCRRWLDGLERLLALVVARPEAPLGQLDLMSGVERHQLLVEWNDTAGLVPEVAGVHQWVAAQAHRRPDAVAVDGVDAQISYGGLWACATGLARHLRREGVGPERPVALAVGRSPRQVTAILAILQAGGYYVPIDRQAPPARLAFQLADLRVRHVVWEPSFGTRPRVEGLTVIDVEAVEKEWEAKAPSTFDGVSSKVRSRIPGTFEDTDLLAYVMYTSGSTGTPKGVGVAHRSILRLVRDPSYLRLGPDEVGLHFAPAAFDASTLELWAPLAHGGRLVLGPEGASLAELAELLQSRRVSLAWLTSGLFHQLVEEHPEALVRLRQLLAGGDVLRPPTVAAALSAIGASAPSGGFRRMINGYGPTENTTFTCCHVMTREGEVGDPVPIGRPIDDTGVWILDPDLDPVPLGVAGVLFTSGAGLARGYLGRPVETAQRFLPHPRASLPGERIYATGDRARWLADGRVEFLGRVDYQAKVRGFRVEPGEVESVLEGFPEVSGAMVVARELGLGDRRLVAYLVPAEGALVVPKELASRLREKLPSYLVPSHFVPLDAFPLTPSGKVDRRALPAPEDRRSKGERVTPRTPLEGKLVAIYTEVLGIGEVSTDDDFFELGGHSLLATQVVSRIRVELGVELPLDILFANPTVAALAASLEDAAPASVAEDREPIAAMERGDLDLEALLAELDDLDDDQAAALLAEEDGEEG